jgi:hypothetical protein
LIIAVRRIIDFTVGVQRNIEVSEIRLRNRSKGSNDVGGTDIDNVGITPDAVSQRVKFEHVS